MHDKTDWRHELKYQISYADYLALRSRIRTVMRSDPHSGPDGRYLIRSIYFDNYNDKALREKVNGVQRREKFRIRWYNDDYSYIRLEKKLKYNNLGTKLSASLTLDEVRMLCENKTDWMAEHPQALVWELYSKMKLQQLRPRVVVSYCREPYIYDAGNVRITFDSEIRTSLFQRELIESTLDGVSATDVPGDMILEVKYDAFLPDVIAMLLQCEGVRQGAFSKYGICRRFG